jgi:hypothetical protein
MSSCFNLAIGAIIFSAAAFAADPSAMIVDSGSTNRAGFRIVLDPAGHAVYSLAPRRRPAKEAEPVEHAVPASLVQRFFSDLDAAKPLSSLPDQPCLKSASFGSTLRVELGAEKTPDLSCPDESSPHIQNLKRDVNEIVKLFPRAGSPTVKALERVPPSPEPGH